ncbi:hypothetical protein HYR99_06790 [Candidatus Poribacteria bacterium]|nr:hypothetical protein [Candidatus Poribacteria bacterium]
MKHKKNRPREGKPRPKPNPSGASASRPMNPDVGELLKKMAQNDPKMMADALNKMFKASGQEVNMTPEDVLLADFQFDGENLRVGRPVIPKMTSTGLGASLREVTAQFANSNMPPITPKQLLEQMEDFADTGARFMAEDHGHGTMLFPFLYGGPLAIIGLADVNFNDRHEGRYHAARIRVEGLPSALEGFILIAQAWVVMTLSQEALPGRVSEHPKRCQALVVAGAHANGWRHTICVTFDENWRVIGRVSTSTPGIVLACDKMVNLLADACFDPDTDKWRQVIEAHDAQTSGET